MAAKALEDVPVQLQDWLPDSDDKILHLVHSSLFPLHMALREILPDGLTNLDDCIKRRGDGTALLVTPHNVLEHPPALDLLGAVLVSDPYSKEIPMAPVRGGYFRLEWCKVGYFLRNVTSPLTSRFE